MFSWFLLVACGLLAVFFCLLIPWLMVLRRRGESRLFMHRIARLRQKMEAALNDDEGFEVERQAFGTALKNARLTTELQRPRLENLAGLEKNVPEKYRILSTLAAQGLDIEEIASILGISSTEANQLLKLSRVAQSRD